MTLCTLLLPCFSFSWHAVCTHRPIALHRIRDHELQECWNALGAPSVRCGQETAVVCARRAILNVVNRNKSAVHGTIRHLALRLSAFLPYGDYGFALRARGVRVG